MQPLGAVLLIGLAYLAGSIPFGVIVARLAGAPDPRTTGSGRTGGTNALRAMGRKLAAIVVLGDLAKGAVPVLVARWVSGGDPALEAACGVAAVIGSARSIFLGFHCVRGVATALMRAVTVRGRQLGHRRVFIRSSHRSRAVAAMGDALDATIVDLGRGRIELVFDTDSDARSA